MTLPNSSTLALMRSQANALMSTAVSIYDVIATYDAYGQQIVSSGLAYNGSGYVGAIKGSDEELLNRMGYTGMATQVFVTVLIPFGTDIAIDQIVRANNTDYRVVWSNANTQDSVQIYSKAICAIYTVENEKRRL
jgi:hypothetical protein